MGLKLAIKEPGHQWRYWGETEYSIEEAEVIAREELYRASAWRDDYEAEDYYSREDDWHGFDGEVHEKFGKHLLTVLFETETKGGGYFSIGVYSDDWWGHIMDMGACPDGIRLMMEHETPTAALEACDNLDYMIWLLEMLNAGQVQKSFLWLLGQFNDSNINELQNALSEVAYYLPGGEELGLEEYKMLRDRIYGHDPLCALGDIYHANPNSFICRVKRIAKQTDEGMLPILRKMPVIKALVEQLEGEMEDETK